MFRSAWPLLKHAFNDWDADNGGRLGAALAYYTLFSVAPLLTIAVGMAGLVFGEEAARGQVVAQIQGLVGPEGARAIEDLVQNSRRPEAGLTATGLGLLTLFVGASGAFLELKGALNLIWKVQAPAGGIWGLVKSRLAAFVLVLVVGFLLLVSLAVSAALAAAGSLLSRVTPSAVTDLGLLQVVNVLVSLGVITLLFALIFKYVPDTRVDWRDVWVGAAITAVLFSAGKTLIGLYLGRGAITSTFGAAASVVVLVVWVYYAAQIFYFGAELTQAFARRHGSRTGPAGAPS
jgi:membrane protein